MIARDARLVLLPIALLFLVVPLAPDADAQPGAPGLRLDWAHPVLRDDADGVRWYSGLGVLAARAPLPSATAFDFELPLLFVEGDGLLIELDLGNPYLGVRRPIGSGRLVLDAGVRPPLHTVDPDAYSPTYARRADPFRVEAFSRARGAVGGGLTVTRLDSPVWAAPWARVGVVGLVRPSDGAEATALVDAEAGLAAMRGAASYALLARVRWDTGRLLFPEPAYQASLAGEWRARRLRPGLRVGIPIDGATAHDVSLVLAASLRIARD